MTLVVQLEFDPEPEPDGEARTIQGRIVRDGEPDERFSGWLQLLAGLEGAIRTQSGGS